MIVLGSPFMGQLQSFLRRSLSTRNYVLLFGVGVLAAIGVAILIAFVRIRERRPQRFALLLVALVFGGAYMWWTATPYADVNAVERVHFVEYGLIAFLFYRAWKPAGDPSIVILPLLAGFTVGTFDEWLQWFIPFRVGEAHDVFINLAALVCGLLFAVALLPPAAFRRRLQPASWRRLGAAAAMVWLIFAAFISQVHLGRVVNAADSSRFRSHYTEDELNALQGHRQVLWRSKPPIGIKRLSREDQYLDEGLWHVRRRNTAEVDEAWHENLILERFFVPVLDLPTYASPNGNRWPQEQRDNIAKQIVSGAAFMSSAEPYPLVVWPRAAFWSVVALMTLVFAIGPTMFGRWRQ
jgi:VanZ like family